MRWLDLLQAGKIDEFNRSRGQRARVDLFGADLAGLALQGVDLSGANLGKADLTTADLEGATLYKADLDGIDGSGANLRGVLAMKARLVEAWLEDADLTGADLSGAEMAEANMVHTKGAGIKLVGARMREVDASGATWPGADLTEARLHKTQLSEADLTGAKLDEVVAAEASFERARLDGASGRAIRMAGANLTGASLVGNRWPEVDLSGANLAGANLEGADFTRANLVGADLRGARLVRCVLTEAALDGVQWEGADVSGAVLTGVDPAAVGLDPAQIASLGASGLSPVASDAPVRFGDVRAAARPGIVGLVWINQDGDGAAASIRAGVGQLGGFKWCTLPVQAAVVVAHGITPTSGGFLVVLLVDRPGGIQLVRFVVDDAGVHGEPASSPLGYEAGVEPVIVSDGEGGARLFGLARRGPSLVIQRLSLVPGPDGLSVSTHIERTPTARGFVGRHAPVLACKGDVVVPVSGRGVGAPVRVPAEAATGRHLVAVQLGDVTTLGWAVAPKGKEKGGIRTAVLGGRSAPEVEVVGQGLIASLDAAPVSGGAWWVWATATGPALPSGVWLARAGEDPFDLGVRAHVDEVRFAVGPGVDTPFVVVVTLDEQVVVVDTSGARLFAAP